MKRRDPPFGPFRPVPSVQKTVEDWMAKGYSRDKAEIAMSHASRGTLYANNIYQVQKIRLEESDAPGFPLMVWLSIKRIDRRPIHDWRHLQRIKNELVGPENEAIEVYPAESRLVDTANQYHLWVLVDPALRLPFGFTERMIGQPLEAARVGAVQRPFEEVANS